MLIINNEELKNDSIIEEIPKNFSFGLSVGAAKNWGTQWDNPNYIAKEWVKNSGYALSKKKDSKIIIFCGKNFFAVLDFGGFNVNDLNTKLKNIGGDAQGVRKNIGGMEIWGQSFDTSGIASYYDNTYYEVEKWKGYLHEEDAEIKLVKEPEKRAWAEGILNLNDVIKKISDFEVSFDDIEPIIEDYLNSIIFNDDKGFTLFWGKNPVYNSSTGREIYPFGKNVKKKVKSEFKGNGMLTNLESEFETKWVLENNDVYAWDSHEDEIKQLKWNFPFKFIDHLDTTLPLPVSTFIDGNEIFFEKGGIKKINKHSKMVIRISEKQLNKGISKKFNSVNIYNKDENTEELIAQIDIPSKFNLETINRYKLVVNVYVNGDPDKGGFKSNADRTDLDTGMYDRALFNWIEEELNKFLLNKFKENETKSSFSSNPDYAKYQRLNELISDSFFTDLEEVEEVIKKTKERKSPTKKRSDSPDRVRIQHEHGDYQYACAGAELGYSISWWDKDGEVAPPNDWEWEISNPEMVKVTSNKRYLEFQDKLGKVEIKIKSPGVVSNSIEIEIVKINEIKSAMESDEIEVEAGAKIKLNVKVTTAGEESMELTDKTVALYWDSQDKKIASVGTHGMVSGIEVGETIIEVSDFGDAAAIFNVNVVPSTIITNDKKGWSIRYSSDPCEICDVDSHEEDVTADSNVIHFTSAHFVHRRAIINVSFPEYVRSNEKGKNIFHEYLFSIYTNLRSWEKIKNIIDNMEPNELSDTLPTNIMQHLSGEWSMEQKILSKLFFAFIKKLELQNGE